MQNNKEFDILVEWLRSDSLYLEEIVSICAKVEAWLKIKTPLEKTVKAILASTWISVRCLLESLYEQWQAYAEEIEYSLLDIQSPEFRFSLLEAFSKRNDFTVCIIIWEKKISTTFYFPFDTRENLENLERLLWYLRSQKKGTLYDATIEKIRYSWKREIGYLSWILQDKIEDFHSKVFNFCESFFMGYSDEFEAYNEGKKVKITVKNKKGESYSDEIFNGLDIITLYERVETIEQKFSELKQETEGEWNYEIQIVW